VALGRIPVSWTVLTRAYSIAGLRAKFTPIISPLPVGRIPSPRQARIQICAFSLHVMVGANFNSMHVPLIHLVRVLHPLNTARRPPAPPICTRQPCSAKL
ncbi:unnamed protein product, partial [Sphacelaria rigidula]